MPAVAARGSPIRSPVQADPLPELLTRISELLRKNRQEGLTPEENAEWQRYETVEHLVRLAKARAAAKLKAA